MTIQQLVLNFLAGPSKPRLEDKSSGSSPDALALTETARTLLRTLGCEALSKAVQVRWNPRMRSTAGTANYAKSLVSLNPRLREISDDEVMRTLKHELAHLLAKHR